MRWAAITGALVATAAAATAIGMLAVLGGLAPEGRTAPADQPGSWNGDPRPLGSPDPDPDPAPRSEADHAPDAARPAAPAGPEPRSEADHMSDAARPAAPAWNMTTTPGIVEVLDITFNERSSKRDAPKRVLILDSPTRLSFSFDNQSRVYHHYLLDAWHASRGLAELNRGGAAEGPAGPPAREDGAPGARPQGGTAERMRADAPPRDSKAAASLAEDAHGRRASLDRLYAEALGAINGHRTSMGRDPVQLSGNAAAQMHAQDVLGQLRISHYMSNGEKPYMTYSMAGGAGYVAQNVAFGGYDRPGQCGGHVQCARIDPSASIRGHHNGMMFDDAHADWGHRDNILDPRHTHVSIGVAYTDYTLAFVQNFEARHMAGPGAAGEPANPISLDGSGRITVAGSMDAGLDVHSIGVHHDPMPSAATYWAHADDMSYGLGRPVAHVYEPHPRGYVSTGVDVIMADRWDVSGGSVLVRFDAPEAMSRNGAHTFYVWLEDGAGEPFIGSSRTFMVGDPADPGAGG